MLSNFSLMIFYILTNIKHWRSFSIGASCLLVGAAIVSIQPQIKATNNKDLANDNAAE